MTTKYKKGDQVLDLRCGWGVVDDVDDVDDDTEERYPVLVDYQDVSVSSRIRI